MAGICDLDLLVSMLDDDIEEGATEASSSTQKTANNRSVVNTVSKGDNISRSPIVNNGSKRKDCIEMPPTANSCSKKNDSSNISAIEAELKAMQERMMLLQQQLEAQKQESQKAEKSISPPCKKMLQDVSLPWIDKVTDTKPKQKPKALSKSKATTPKPPSQLSEIPSYIHDDLDLTSSEEEAERYPLENRGLNEFGKVVKKRLSHQPKYDPEEFKQKATWLTQKKRSSTQTILPNLLPKVENQDNDVNGNIQTEFFSGLRIVNPTISSAAMKEKMAGKKMIRLSVMQTFMRGGDIEGDWVTIGVILSKSEPRTSANGKNFTIWRLNDLRDCSKIVSFFLFGKVHQQLWKTPVGTVLGLLNPSIMPSRDSNFAGGNDISVTVDHPQKVMLMGKSKDLGTCRGRRKDGSTCTMIVNVDVCEFCPFHIQAAYKKVSSKRMDLQSSFSSSEPKGLRQKILKKQEIFYGGQSFTSSPTPNSNKRSNKKLIIDSLKLQKKAELVKQEALMSGKSSIAIAPTTSTALEEMLAVPTAGSRNLVKHLTQEIEEEENKGKAKVCSITAKDLLKLHAQEAKIRQATAANAKRTLTNSVTVLPKLSPLPTLGFGIGQGQDILFDEMPVKKTTHSPGKIKKLKAMAKVKQAGPLVKVNPNAVKKVKSPDMVQRVKKRLKDSGIDSEPDKEPSIKRLCVGEEKIDFDKYKDLINRKSMYEDSLNTEQAEKQEKYFDALEKKENMEMHMSSIREIPCDVVSCKKCRYTAFSAAERCKEEHHPLVYHKGKKRFFSCRRCKQRTISLNKLPTKACNNCGESNYERVGMWKERSGPKLASETLSLRGDEVKHLGTIEIKDKNLNL